MRQLLALAVSAAFTQTLAAQTTRIVPSASYPTIQSAIVASVSGDTVLVNPGTYVENLDLLGLDLVVRSTAGARQTTIDGGGIAATVFYSPGSTRAAILDGFTIVNGRGSSATSPARPTQTPGGGIAIRGSSPTILNCIVRGNSHPAYGGGIGGTPTFAPETLVACSPRIFNCVVESNFVNTASFASGGGICLTGFAAGAVTGTPEIEQCIIRDNGAITRGGGVYVGYNQNALVKDCVITRNTTTATSGSLDGGAGIWYALNAQPLIVNCTIFSNVSFSNGGGVKFFNVTGGQVLNCTIVNNTGGSIAGYNNTGSFGAGTTSNITNSICWNNGAVETDVRTSGSTLPVINMNYTDIAGGYAGTGNISADPQILNLASTNQRLTAASPCINVGNNAASGLPAADFEGNPRVIAGTVDMGADEFDPNAVFLAADRGTVSVATGGTINLQVNGGAGRANMVYVILPSLGGTKPGIDLGPLHLPLNFDGSSVILLSAYASTLGGALNAGGGGSGSMALGTSLPPGLIGQTISFAAVVIDLSLQINAFSNDENIDFLP